MNKKLTSSIILGTTLFSALAFSPVNVAAETETDLQNRISDLANQESTTQAELEAATAEIKENEAKLADLAKQLETSQAEEEKLAKEIKELEENIKERKSHLSDQVRSIQIDGNIGNYIEFIVEAESFSDIVARIQVVSDIVSANQNVVAEQQRDRDAVAEKKEQTEKEIERQLASVEELESLSSTLAQQKADKEVLVAQLAIERAGAEADLASLVAQREAAEARANELANSQAAAQEAVNANGGSVDVAVATTTASNENQASGESVATSSNTSSSSNSSNSSQASSSSNSSSASTSSQPAKASAPAAPSASGGSALSIASQYVGTPYAWGGSTPGGFDCSGFTSYVFAKAGRSLPRTAAAQYAATTRVSNPQPGDLVFFTHGNGIEHVAIYTGGGSFIGAQSSGVGYSSTSNPYWGPRVVGYGRP